jgi:hypothetical protein
VNEPVDAARHELHDALAATRATLARARVVPLPQAELDALQRQALSGRLGPELRHLAERVADGATSWAAVFDGSAPDTDLARAHVVRMAAVHGPRLLGRLR